MTAQASLALVSIAVAVLWTALMIWWTGTDIANIVGLSISGAVFGVLWYFAMRWYLRWSASRRAR